MKQGMISLSHIQSSSIQLSINLTHKKGPVHFADSLILIKNKKKDV